MTQSRPLVHKQHAESYLFLGVAMKILLSSADTGGQFSLIEGLMPPGGDGGLHVHAKEDESMHLLEGSLDVTIGDRNFALVAGESYFAPPQRSAPVTKLRQYAGARPAGHNARRLRRVHCRRRHPAARRQRATAWFGPLA